MVVYTQWPSVSVSVFDVLLCIRADLKKILRNLKVTFILSGVYLKIVFVNISTRPLLLRISVRQISAIVADVNVFLSMTSKENMSQFLD